jgi:hypothetical protein
MIGRRSGDANRGSVTRRTRGLEVGHTVAGRVAAATAGWGREPQPPSICAETRFPGGVARVLSPALLAIEARMAEAQPASREGKAKDARSECPAGGCGQPRPTRDATRTCRAEQDCPPWTFSTWAKPVKAEVSGSRFTASCGGRLFPKPAEPPDGRTPPGGVAVCRAESRQRFMPTKPPAASLAARSSASRSSARERSPAAM